MSAIQWTGATLRFLPALVWAIMARSTWGFLLSRKPQSPLFRIFPPLATLVALDFSLSAFLWLLPTGAIDWQGGNHPPAARFALLLIITDLSTIWSLALLRHMICYLGIPERRPARTWLVANYGAALAMSGLALTFTGLFAGTFAEQLKLYRLIYFGYQLCMFALALIQLGRIARRGRWRPGTMVMRYRDVAAIGGGTLMLVGFLLLVAWDRSSQLLWLGLDCLMGLAVTVPVAVRYLGESIRALVTALVIFAAALAAYSTLDFLVSGQLEAGFVHTLEMLAGFLLALAAIALHPVLSAAIDRVLFRRTHSRRDELQSILHGLPPDLGSVECARRALGAAVRVMQFGGGAILLRDGQALGAGTIDLERIGAVWPQGSGADALPLCSLKAYTVSDLPLPMREAMIEAEVIAILPIRSPRRSWGHLLAAAGRLTVGYADEDGLTIEGFVDQLALVLDAAELLERAVSVERSLAHSEKLAAIGELAARIAHEIRNPVTAARSLAQQLSRQPVSPHNAEHAGLILTELERVERQVASLLRFARREDLRFERVDLGELARGTVESFRSRLEAAGIAVACLAPDGITARADREKLRQVLINLIENSIDALADQRGSRELRVVVGQSNGSATMQVSDNGPGVAADTVGRLFEPFFSLKPHGTGLGLAIARRTVEEHGGRIDVASARGTGMTFAIELPTNASAARPRDGRSAGE